MATSKVTLTDLRTTVAELQELVNGQSAMIEVLIRDNDRLVAFAEKAAPVLNHLVQSQRAAQNTPPFNPTNTRTSAPAPAPQPQPQAQKPSIKTLPRSAQQRQPATSPSGAMYEQYKLAVRARAVETGKSITLVPFGKATTMTLEQLMATIK